ncbi:MAG TPA: hypothetical protein VM163_09065 [bacterium]|nr:hypothetical protein [bacterium]
MKSVNSMVFCLVLLCAFMAAHVGEGSDAKITNYRNWDFIVDVASRGNVIAVGTMCGALVLNEGQVTLLSTDNAVMGFSQVGAVDVAPDGSVWIGGWGLCRYSQGEVLNYPLFDSAYTVAAISRDEAWVVGSMPGNYDDYLFHVNAAEVKPVEIDGYPDELIFDGFGNVFCSADGWIFWYDTKSGSFVECPGFDVDFYVFARDASGFAYVASEDGLWRFDGDQWHQIADGTVWAPFPYGPSGFSFAEDGTLWAYAGAGLLRRDEQSGQLFTEGCGINLVFEYDDDSTWRNGVRGIAALEGTQMVVGTRSDGLLVFDGHQFSHVGFGDGPPDNIITDLVEDFRGRMWVGESGAFGIGCYDGAAWDYFDPEGVFSWFEVAATCVDTNGSIQFFEYPGRLISFDGAEFLVQEGYDHGVTDCVGVQMEPAADGELWVSLEGSDFYDFSGAARIRGDDWELFPTYDLFPGRAVSFGPAQFGCGTHAKTSGDRGRAPTIVMAPDNRVWLILGSVIRTFDGRNWGGGSLPTPVPFAQSDVSGAVFDVEERLVFFTAQGVFRSDGECWTQLYEESALKGTIDADGAIWFIGFDQMWKFELVSIKPDGTVITLDETDGLADCNLLCVTVDHNGDKWVGTTGGLSRVENDGPAQQSLQLSTSVNPQGVLTLSAQLTNAGRIIPVSLWLACQYNGQFYYYPDWGQTPTPVDLTLSASSIQPHVLLNIDTSSLPPGDYTFYGGVSLLGGMDLLIGARGNKIAVATYSSPVL